MEKVSIEEIIDDDLAAVMCTNLFRRVSTIKFGLESYNFKVLESEPIDCC